ncbi:hypothetical protein MASR2M78_35910 [Treponema sp.]
MREKKALQAPFLGACIVLISLAFPFSSTKPNRIALSEYLSFFSILQKGGLLSLLPVLSLVLGLFFAYRARYGKYPLQAALSGAFFALSGLLTLSIAVMNSAALVSPSLSFWLLIFAAWASSERAVRESRLAFFWFWP